MSLWMSGIGVSRGIAIGRVRRLLKTDRAPALNDEAIVGPTIIVSDDLTPADILALAQQSVVAFVTESGGSLAPAAILARSLGIPGVMGVYDAHRLLRENEQVIVDGELGHVLAAPESLALAFYARKQRQA